jgi:hypothetical protein
MGVADVVDLDFFMENLTNEMKKSETEAWRRGGIVEQIENGQSRELADQNYRTQKKWTSKRYYGVNRFRRRRNERSTNGRSSGPADRRVRKIKKAETPAR